MFSDLCVIFVSISPFAAPFFDLDLVGKIFLFLKKKTSASCGVVLGKVVNVYKKKSTPKMARRVGKRNKQKRKNYLYLEIEKTCSAMDFASVLGGRESFGIGEEESNWVFLFFF